jgi:hypothetical protein
MSKARMKRKQLMNIAFSNASLKKVMMMINSVARRTMKDKNKNNSSLNRPTLMKKHTRSFTRS